jgi:hypothetical protein
MLHYGITIESIDIAVGKYRNAAFTKQRANEFTEFGK